MPDGQMAAVAAQIAEARGRGRDRCDDCIVRIVWSGDMLSLCGPSGHGGPTSKKPCLKCLSVLHETNMAGVPHVPNLPASWTQPDPRPAHIAQPPPRAGTAAIAHQSKMLSTAGIAHAAGLRSKPEPMHFDSCIHQPLFRVRSSFDDSTSCIPLHILLGVTTDYFHALEGATEALDSQVIDQLELPPEGTDDLIKRLRKMLADMKTSGEERVAAEGDCADHRNALAAIKALDAGAAAFEAAAQRRNAKRKVPHEDEVRTHQRALHEAMQRCKKADDVLTRLEQQLIELRGEKPGPFRSQWNNILHAMRLKCAAYHGGQLVGDDADAVLMPEPIAKLTECVKPKVHSRLWVAGGRVQFRVCAPGSYAVASRFHNLMTTFSRCVSLFGRKEPLCEHQIAAFARHRDEHAIAYAKTFPTKEPTVKIHWLGYHMHDQLLRWGSCGQFHEGVVEAAHVLDNEYKRRFACVTDPLKQLLLRLQAFANQADAGRSRLSGKKEARQEESREKRKRGCRRARHGSVG